jgi:uncharacterized protein YukE
MSLRVNLEDLLVAGVAVSGHGEDLAAAHAAADGRIDAARSGWQGVSAAALGERAQGWAAATDSLLARLGDHAHGLNACAHEFWLTEQHNAGELRVGDA